MPAECPGLWTGISASEHGCRWSIRPGMTKKTGSGHSVGFTLSVSTSMDVKDKIVQAEGVTTTERLLKSLCDHSFLKMWTYPGIFRDQGNGAGGHGKEICDVLVVFANDILIFSDKSCQFNTLIDEQLAWKRWFRKSVWDSAGQAWGAERWIREHPDRLFIDRACNRRFPLTLPASESTRFHHIVVAHGLPDVGSGNQATHLKIDSRFIGLDAHAPEIGPRRPFFVDWLEDKKSFVHVFSGHSLKNVLKKLDTVSDFTSYLTQKEKLFREGNAIVAEREEDLLAIYLRQLNSDNEHDFIFRGRPGPLTVAPGEWERFEASPQRRTQIQAKRLVKGGIGSSKISQHTSLMALPIILLRESYLIEKRLSALWPVRIVRADACLLRVSGGLWKNLATRHRESVLWFQHRMQSRSMFFCWSDWTRTRIMTLTEPGDTGPCTLTAWFQN